MIFEKSTTQSRWTTRPRASSPATPGSTPRGPRSSWSRSASAASGPPQLFSRKASSPLTCQPCPKDCLNLMLPRTKCRVDVRTMTWHGTERSTTTRINFQEPRLPAPEATRSLTMEPTTSSSWSRIWLVGCSVTVTTWPPWLVSMDSGRGILNTEHGKSDTFSFYEVTCFVFQVLQTAIHRWWHGGS